MPCADCKNRPQWYNAFMYVFETRRFLKLSYKTQAFLFAVVTIFFMLFMLGNYQQFLDRSQHLIMNMLTLAIVLHLLTGIFYIIFLVIHNDRTLYPSRRRFVVLICSLSVSLVIFIILQFFQVWLNF